MNTQPTSHSIASAKVLAQLPEEAVAKLESMSTAVRVDAGKVLTSEGAKGREFGVLITGSATVTIGDTEVATLEAGDHYGEMALLESVGQTTTHRSATVVAAEDLWVSVMTTREFDGLALEFPEVIDAITSTAAERVRANDVLV